MKQLIGIIKGSHLTSIDKEHLSHHLEQMCLNAEAFLKEFTIYYSSETTRAQAYRRIQTEPEFWNHIRSVVFRYTTNEAIPALVRFLKQT